jgi:hypothetical protein
MLFHIASVGSYDLQTTHGKSKGAILIYIVMLYARQITSWETTL